MPPITPPAIAPTDGLGLLLAASFPAGVRAGGGEDATSGVEKSLFGLGLGNGLGNGLGDGLGNGLGDGLGDGLGTGSGTGSGEAAAIAEDCGVGQPHDLVVQVATCLTWGVPLGSCSSGVVLLTCWLRHGLGHGLGHGLRHGLRHGLGAGAGAGAGAGGLLTDKIAAHQAAAAVA